MRRVRIESFFSTAASQRPNATAADGHENNEPAHENEPLHDFFRVLGLEPSFAIDPLQLKALYKKLMTEFHPDKHRLASAAQQLAAQQQAAAVSAAYDTLQRPHERATHLLHVLGHALDEKDAAAATELVGPEFLMEIMERREIIDAATADAALKPLLHENQQRMTQCVQRLTEQFAQSNVSAARELTAQLQYWHRIDETIRDKMTSLE